MSSSGSGFSDVRCDGRGGGGQRPAGHRPAQRRPDPVEPALAGLHTIELIFDTVVTLN